MAFTLTPASGFFVGDTLTAAGAAPGGGFLLTFRTWYFGPKDTGPWTVLPGVGGSTWAVTPPYVNKFFYVNEVYNLLGDILSFDSSVAGPALSISSLVGTQKGSFVGDISCKPPSAGAAYYSVYLGQHRVASGLTADAAEILAQSLADRFYHTPPSGGYIQ